ncbi:1-aminocyclopropane-1-carboxylate deaminase/D-cysteine desulfhydrase [Candidatus Solincola sp.]|nr:pyridoxal-phosphate dependent enzyme [Actinomycetota bacterium]
MEEEYPLFRRFPMLGAFLPRVPLGVWPTPVERLSSLERRHGLPPFYVKRDDLSSPHYGGNKVRKLEFTLADALRLGCRVVMTMGAAGSNHVLATAVHGRRVGLRTVALLFDQPCAEYVRRNLLLDARFVVRFRWASSIPLIPLAYLGERLYHLGKGEKLYWLGPGGSSVLGCLGYVNAGLGIAEQVERGLLPEPGLVVTAMGTHGTAAGLWVGMKLAGLGSQLVGVGVVETAYCNPFLWARLVNRVAELLQGMDESIRVPRARPSDLLFVGDQLGRGYAHLTREDVQAVREAYELEGLRLEGTYTGKALAAALRLGGGCGGRPVLFVNTCNSADLSHLVEGIDYHNLPYPLHRFFSAPWRELEEELVSLAGPRDGCPSDGAP